MITENIKEWGKSEPVITERDGTCPHWGGDNDRMIQGKMVYNQSH